MQAFLRVMVSSQRGSLVFSVLLGVLGVVVSATALDMPWKVIVPVIAVVLFLGFLVFAGAENAHRQEGESAERSERERQEAQRDEQDGKMLATLASLASANKAAQTAFALAAEIKRFLARRDTEMRSIKRDVYLRSVEQMVDCLREYDQDFRQRVEQSTNALGGDPELQRLNKLPGPDYPVQVRMIGDKLSSLAQQKVSG